jgi:hypothetical protein
MTHNDKLPYQPESLVHVPLPGWQAERADDGSFLVQGPCPACGGDSWGPDLPNPTVTDTHLTYVAGPSRKAIAIVAACHCGYSHGQDGATSCGRTWSVIVDPVDQQ